MKTRMRVAAAILTGIIAAGARLWPVRARPPHRATRPRRRYTKLTVIFTGKERAPVYVLKNGKPVATYPLAQTFDAN
jgi:hypothetical protein